MKKALLFIPALMLALQSFSQTVKLMNPPSVHTPKGYSHAAVIDLGTCTMVIISGQVATPPASTLVQVSRLFREDIMVEIEATAVIPKK